MNFEATILASIERMAKEAIERAVKAYMPQKIDDCLLTTAQAGEMLACSPEYVRQLQDRGDLSLIFLPGSKHRRVLRSEVTHLIEKSIVQKAKRGIRG